MMLSLEPPALWLGLLTATFASNVFLLGELIGKNRGIIPEDESSETTDVFITL